MYILRSIAIMVLFVLVLGLVQTIDQEAYPATPEGAVRYELVFDKNAMPLCENLDRDYEITTSIKEIEKLDFVEVQNFLQYVHSQATDCEKMCFVVRKYSDQSIEELLRKDEIKNPCKYLISYMEVMMDDSSEKHFNKIKSLQMMCYEREALAQHHQK